MLNEIQNSIRQLVHEYGRIDPLDVDVKFDTPTDGWVNSLTQPTISVFLYDIYENTEKRETNMQVVRGAVKAERRMPPRRVDLSYMVTALSHDVEDEHALLWRVLATLMRYREFPQEVLGEPLKVLDTSITSRIAAQQESGQLLELWNALGTKPHPALCYVITAPLDLELTCEVPLVLSRSARYRLTSVTSGEPHVIVQIGGVIRNKQGEPLAGVVIKTDFDGKESRSNTQGQYLLRNVRNGPMTLSVLRSNELQKKVQFSVPAMSYDIVLDD